MTNYTYHGLFLSLLFVISKEWSDISLNKAAAVFCLLAIIFYLFYLSSSMFLTSRTLNRKSRFLKKKQTRKLAVANLVCTFIFIVAWAPQSTLTQIVLTCCAFLFLVFHLSTLSLGHVQSKTKNELNYKK